MDCTFRVLLSTLMSIVSFDVLALQCDAVDLPNQIVITCLKDATAPIIPPVVPPVIVPAPVTPSPPKPIPTGVVVATPSKDGSVSVAPNCLNGQITECSFTPVTWPNLLAVKYKTPSVVPTGQYFMLRGRYGAGIPVPLTAALSKAPGDLNTECNVTGVQGTYPVLQLKPPLCILEPNTTYYLNIKPPEIKTPFQIKIVEPGMFM